MQSVKWFLQFHGVKQIVETVIFLLTFGAIVEQISMGLCLFAGLARNRNIDFVIMPDS